MEGLRIVVADNNKKRLHQLNELLTKEGYAIVAEAHDSSHLLQHVNTVQPEVIIISSSLPGDNLLDLLFNLQHLKVAPVILIGEKLQMDLLEDSIKSGCFGYIVEPYDVENILPVLEHAVNLFRVMVKLEEENKMLKEEVENRKLIEKAKGLIMEKKKMTEQESYNFLRKMSMDKCIPMHKVAAAVIKKLEG